MQIKGILLAHVYRASGLNNTTFCGLVNGFITQKIKYTQLLSSLFCSHQKTILMNIHNSTNKKKMF